MTGKGKATSGSGSPSLAGYDYQVDVSVWLGLELVVVTRIAEEMTLEPASQEDLEAELAENEPGRVVNRVPLTGYNLIVQAKRKSGDAWTPSTLKTLLQHGSDTRISAAKRLKDPKARYLLVTSATLNGDARKLKVRKAGNWPGKGSVPDVIKKVLATDVTGRLAVIAGEDDERLEGDIDRLLTEGCRVPRARLAACKERLRQDARARVKGAGNGRWTRAEIEDVIRDHDGYLASSPELENFVHPTNWSDLRAAIKKDSAAMIVGQSGTGKTLATLKLYDELRAEMPGLTRIPIRLGPGELRDKLLDQSIPTPVLFDIEDPWGRFDFDPRSRPWNDQLAGFLANADPDHMIIATSRADVAQTSGAVGDVKPWIVPLESENYGKGERQRLYRTRIDGLPRDLQALARGAEGRVLDRLSTPLEIQKFFDGLRTGDRAGLSNPSHFVEKAIDAAHESAIEGTVIDQINERDDVPAAAVVWSQLTAGDKVTRTLVREIEEGLADRDDTMTKGVSPFVDFLVAARDLRQGDGGILTYYHPRVEKGLERALANSRIIARRTISKLLDLLVALNGPDAAWGAGAAARILADARGKFGVQPTAATGERIDAWLAAQVAEGGKAFGRNLELAGRAGSKSSNVGELARHLLRRTDNSFGFDWWEPEDQSDEWFAARKQDETTRPIVSTFVEQLLIEGRLTYPSDLAVQLERLADGLTPAFLTASRRAVKLGVLASDDAIAEGALDDLDGFETIVDMAVAELTPTEKQKQDAAALNLDLTNDVYDEDYAQHLSEDDDGYTASEFLKAYVSRLRRERGWLALTEHRHAERLRPYWTRELAEAVRETRLTNDEVAGAFSAAYGTDDEDDLWLILLTAWNPHFLPQLRTRLVGGAATDRVDEAAVACAVEHAPDTLAEVTAELAAKSDANRLVELSARLARLRRGRSSHGWKHDEAADAAALGLPQPYRSISDALLALAERKKPQLSTAAKSTQGSIKAPSDPVRVVRLRLDEHASTATADDVIWALGEADDAETAVLGVEAAIRHGMTEAVGAAVGHRYAHVAARALVAVAEPIDGLLPQELLDLATHRASPVRKALADVLEAKPHPGHMPTLIKLTGDQWSKHSQYYGQDDNSYPIARKAAEGLAGQPTLDHSNAQAALANAIATGDPKLRRMLLTLLTKSSDPAIQHLVFDVAVQPGRESVKRGADSALIAAGDTLDESVIDRISTQLLATRFAPVAATLAILLGWRGDVAKVREIAVELATDGKRRVLLLLVIWLLKDRDRATAEELAAMLPAHHPGAAWALGANVDAPSDAMIADLGEPVICAEVLIYMRPRDEAASERKSAAKKRTDASNKGSG